jgi:hypothetical protein
MRRIVIRPVICIAITLAVFVLFSGVYNPVFAVKRNDFIPGEWLLYPVTDHIDLSGKDCLEFKWIRTDLVMTDHFDFRLYKGYNTLESNLILKKEFSTDIYPIQIPASQFEKNQVYTWVLVQVLFDGRKGDKAFSSFKIINK